jgi:hypothetical protein
MAIDTAQYDADLAEMIGDESHTVTIAGVDYAVSATDETLGGELELAGWGDTRRAEFAVRASVLGSAGKVNDVLTYKGRGYRIRDRVPGQDDISMRLMCEAVEE